MWVASSVYESKHIAAFRAIVEDYRRIYIAEQKIHNVDR